MKKIMISLGLIAASFLIVLPLQAAEYKVEKGDSLWKIAKDHDTSILKLKEINNLDSDIIFPDQLLNIDEETTYTVRKGDTLSEIGEEFAVTVSDLKGWNELSSDLITIGQELTIEKTVHQNEKESKDVNKQAKEVQATPEKQEIKKKEAKQSTNNASKEETKPATKKSESKQNGETLSVTATAYTADCNGCSGITATGINLNENPNMKVIAVDPNVIPLGSKVYVEGYGEAIAGDTGGAINGNKIDLHVPTKNEAYSWGVRTVDVTILN